MRTESAVDASATVPPPPAQDVPDFVREAAELPEPKPMPRKKKKKGGNGSGEEGPTATDILSEIIEENANFFKSPVGDEWAVVTENGRQKCFAVKSRSFQYWLRRQFKERVGGPVNKTALDTTVDQAKAEVEGDKTETREVFVRLGEHDGKIYWDLFNSDWQAVEIDEDGWRIVNRPPCLFIRPRAPRALPTPVRGGTVEEFKQFFNTDEDGMALTLGFLLGTFDVWRPYPVLVVGGEHGTGKSSFIATVKKILDPARGAKRAMPETEWDLTVAAKHQHVVSFDNLSKLDQKMSDALSRMATGGGVGARELYTNDEEVVIETRKPVILNSIVDVARSSDLLSRTIAVRTQPIAPDQRRTERELEAAIENAGPRLFGVLLDAVSRGLRRRGQANLSHLPRMADFVTWVEECAGGDAEDGAWFPQGAFASLMERTQRQAQVELVKDDRLADLIVQIMRNEPAPRFYSKEELYTALKRAAGDEARDLAFLKSKRALGDALARGAQAMREAGIVVEEHRSKSGRLWKIALKDLSLLESL